MKYAAAVLLKPIMNIMKINTPQIPSHAADAAADIDPTQVPSAVTAPIPPLEVEIASLRAENERLRTTMRDAAAHRQITGELERFGARSPELLFEAVKSDMQFTPDGAVANSAAIVEKLRKKFPEQFRAPKTPPSIDAGAGLTEIPTLSKEALAKMRPEEIAKLDWEEVKRTLANG